MNVQKSFVDKSEKGKIYIVPTPIGNLKDITYRAIETLKEVDLIAAEDTRQTRKILTHFEIENNLTSYHEHNKHTKGLQLLEKVESGQNLAIVSDAGMPGISDPGSDLIQLAVKKNISVIPLPGANAALCGLVGSALSTDHFYFHGFLPRKKKDQFNVIEKIKNMRATIIFYESPHRIKDTLKNLHEVLGDRQVALARELTKRYEEYIRGSLEEAIDWANKSEIRGEFCLIVEGSHEDGPVESELWWSHLTLIDHVNHYIEEQNMSSKEAIKQVAKERKLQKREVYQAYHIE